MIPLYRCVRYPEHTLLTFQGEPSDVDAVSSILHFRPAWSKLPSNYETGYYAYLRGSWREKSEREALSYFAANYHPPLVRLAWYPAQHPLPSDVPTHVARSGLTAAICDYFAANGYSTGADTDGLAIYRRQRYSIARGLEAAEGVLCRLLVGADDVPLLQLDVAYQFVLDGNPASLKAVEAHSAARPGCSTSSSSSPRGIRNRCSTYSGTS
jgi:hypothetical protein